MPDSTRQRAKPKPFRARPSIRSKARQKLSKRAPSLRTTSTAASKDVSTASSSKTPSWLDLDEFVLMQMLNNQIFYDRNCEVAFLSKVFKDKHHHHLHSTGGDKPQIIAISKATATMDWSSLSFHRINVKGVLHQLTFELRYSVGLEHLSKILLDTKANKTSGSILRHASHANPASQEKYGLALHFGSASPYCIHFPSEKEQRVVAVALFRMCKELLQFVPQTSSDFDSGSAGADAAMARIVESRCIILKDIPSMTIEELAIEQGMTDFLDGESTISGLKRDQDDWLNNNNNSSKEDQGQGWFSLSRKEQKLVDLVIAEEAIHDVDAVQIPEKLDQTIQQLERDLEEELMSWEQDHGAGKDRRKSSRGAAAISVVNLSNGSKMGVDHKGSLQGLGMDDPIDYLIAQLDNVETKLNQVEEWMSFHNTELRDMKLGIHKIENENNKLQLETTNHTKLRHTLESLFQRYSVDDETQELLQHLQPCLQEIQEEVEDGKSPRAPEARPEFPISPPMFEHGSVLSQQSMLFQDQFVSDPALGDAESAMWKLQVAARKLQLALHGRSGMDDDEDDEDEYDGLVGDDRPNARDAVGNGRGDVVDDATGEQPSALLMEYEEHMVAVLERKRVIQDMIFSFGSHLDMFLENRVHFHATTAMQDVHVETKNGLPVLGNHGHIHERLVGYGPLVLEIRDMDKIQFEQVLLSYVKDIGRLYEKRLKQFFEALVDLVENQSVSDSRMSAMPDCALDGYAEEKKLAEESVATILRTDATNGKLTAALALRYSFDQLLPVILKEQQFMELFFWGDAGEEYAQNKLEERGGDNADLPIDSYGSFSMYVDQQLDYDSVDDQDSSSEDEGSTVADDAASNLDNGVSSSAQSAGKGGRGRDAERSEADPREQEDAEYTKHVEKELNKALYEIFVDIGGLVHYLEQFVTTVRGSSNNFEMLNMVVDVESIVRERNNPSDFFVQLLTNPQNGLQLSLHLAFSSFVEDQLKWIDSLRPDPRYCGILSPFKKFPAFVDQVLTVWDTCVKGDALHKIETPQHQAFAGNSVGIALQKTATTILNWLKRVSGSKPKYSLLVRMENLYFFYITVGARNIPALGQFVEQARFGYLEARDLYITYSIQRQFPKLLEFLDAVDATLETIAESDLVYHISKDEFKKVRGTVSVACVRAGMKNIRTRQAKHLCKDAGLQETVNSASCERFVQYIDRFSQIAEKSYGEKDFEPSVDTILEVIANTRRGNVSE